MRHFEPNTSAMHKQNLTFRDMIDELSEELRDARSVHERNCELHERNCELHEELRDMTEFNDKKISLLNEKDEEIQRLKNELKATRGLFVPNPTLAHREEVIDLKETIMELREKLHSSNEGIEELQGHLDAVML